MAIEVQQRKRTDRIRQAVIWRTHLLYHLRSAPGAEPTHASDCPGSSPDLCNVAAILRPDTECTHELNRRSAPTASFTPKNPVTPRSRCAFSHRRRRAVTALSSRAAKRWPDRSIPAGSAPRPVSCGLECPDDDSAR